MGTPIGAVRPDAGSARLEALRRTQNPDGGWGYFPNKQSWLEPTFYAAVALHDEPAADRAWALLKSWQMADGSWRPGADVQVASWGTSLCVNMAHERGEFGDSYRKGVNWMLGSEGVEGPLWQRLMLTVFRQNLDRDLSLKGWPWKPGTASWVEPTSHALIALKKASGKISNRSIRARIQDGEAQLMDIRCKDGGWNYGNRAVLHIDLPSYPETTAIALVGLQGRKDLGTSLSLASRMAVETTSPLARAWLTIALKLHGVEVPKAGPNLSSSPETVVLALEAIAEKNYEFFRTGAAA